MPDDDWDGDGRAGGSGGTGRTAADGWSGPERSGAHATNVVPFPGSWFGSVDELVPIDPEPQPLRLTTVAPVPVAPAAGVPIPAAPVGVPDPVAAESVAPGPVAPPGLAPVVSPPAVPQDASAFWDGDATPLQEVVAAAPVDVAPSSTTGAAEGMAPAAASQSPSAQGFELAEAEEPSGRHRGLRVPVLATLVLVLVAAGVSAVFLVDARPTGPALNAARDHGLTAAAKGVQNRPAVTRTIMSSVTVTTTVPARGDHPRRVRDRKPRPSDRLGSAATTVPASSGLAQNAASQQPSATDVASTDDSSTSGSAVVQHTAGSGSTVAQHPSGSGSGATQHASGSGSGAAQHASDSDLATAHGTSTPDSTAPPAKTSRNTAGSGQGCGGAQSPDSGCVP